MAQKMFVNVNIPENDAIELDKILKELYPSYETVEEQLEVWEELGIKWIEEHISNSRKEEILSFFKIEGEKFNLDDITNKLSEINKISKPSTLKHIDFLVKNGLLKSEMVITDKWRERQLTLTKTGQLVNYISEVKLIDKKLKKLSFK